MNPLSLVAMVIFTSISLLLVRSLAPYQKTSQLKFIYLNNKFLAKFLIPTQKGYVKVDDRKKISVFSFVFYILFAVLLLALITLFFLPDITCEQLYELPPKYIIVEENCGFTDVLPENSNFSTEIWDITNRAEPFIKFN